ncbi:hypothetical protein D6C93_04324, partial [Aureobasidium pullulans]
HPARESQGPFNCRAVPFSVELQRQTYTGNFESTDGGKAAVSLTGTLSCSPWHSNGKASAAPLTPTLSHFSWNSNDKASASNYNATDGGKDAASLTGTLSCSLWHSNGKVSTSNHNSTDGESGGTFDCNAVLFPMALQRQSLC